MIKDFKAWYDQTSDLFSHLKHHNSLIFDYLNDCLIVLCFLAKKQEKDLTEDEALAFEVGFSYLYARLDLFKIYLEKYFNNNLNNLLRYDALIYYAIYLEDLKDSLIEQNEFSEVIKKAFLDLEEKIEDILTNKITISDEVISEINNTLLSLIPSKKEFLTIPEVFFRLAEEMQI